MPRVKDDPQPNMFDRTIEDEEFADALASQFSLQEDEAFAAKRRDLAAAKALVASKLVTHQVKAGEHIRVGRFVIAGVERAGGGFEVPAWSKVVLGDIRETS